MLFNLTCTETRHVHPYPPWFRKTLCFNKSVVGGHLNFIKIIAGHERKGRDEGMTTCRSAGRSTDSSLVCEKKGTDVILNMTRKRIHYASWHYLIGLKAHSMRGNPLPTLRVLQPRTREQIGPGPRGKPNTTYWPGK